MGTSTTAKILKAVGSRLLAMAILFQPFLGWSQVQVNVKCKTSSLASILHDISGDVSPADISNLRTSITWSDHLQKVEPLSQAVEAELGNLFTLRFDELSTNAVVQRLSASGDFEWVEENRKTQLQTMHSTDADTATDPQAYEQWYHRYIRTYEAWKVTRGSSSVVVGVIDTGIDYLHPELKGQMALSGAEDINGNGTYEPWSDTTVIGGITGDFDGIDNDANGYADDVIGYDFTDQPRNPVGGDYLFPDPNPADDNAHGTLVSGIIVAKADNLLGGAGIAPQCRVRAIRAFAADGSGEDDDIARAILYAADNGIRILNMSFGSPYASRMMHEAIQYAESKGVVMLASAGNGTGDNIHYPSNFNEVISVSATALGSDGESELPWLLSSFGLTLSLAAPGSNILCPTLGDSLGDPAFDFYSGTSTSAPMVSAAVALLFAQRGAQTPQQVRHILTTSADDVSYEGWDHYTGAGRLNIEEMLKVVGGGNVQILSPLNDAGSSSDTVWITGTVLDPEFLRYHVEFQPGTDGDNDWFTIASDETLQVKEDTLAAWVLAGLPDGEYTLRIRSERTDGRTVEDRVRFIRDRSAATFRSVRAVMAWDNNERALLFTSKTDDEGLSVLQYRKVGSTSWKELAFDFVTRSTYFLVPASNLSTGDYEWQIASTNAAGLQSMSVMDTVSFTKDFLSMEGYSELPFELPMGSYLPRDYDMDGDGLKEVVMSNYGDRLTFGQMEVHEYNAGAFVKVDSVTFKPILLPKDIADSDGDGLAELLCSVNDSIYWLEATTAGGYPSSIQWSNLGNSLYPSKFADTDNDGALEMMVKDFKDYFVLERTASNWNQTASLPDDSPDYEGSLAPRSLHGDFDGDGQPEVIFGDYDGDLIVYEWNGSGYVNTFTDTTSYSRLGTYISQGDFDGDGSLEIFTAAHTSLLLNEEFEYEAPHWQLRILESTADNTYTTVWSDYLFDIDSESYNAATATNVDTDAADEIVFSTFPRTYVIDFTGGEYKPSWFHYGAIATHHVAGDFNSNGVKEFALGFGDHAEFFEYEFSYTGPRAPAMLTGRVLDSTSIQLSWPAAVNANEYRIWRGEVTGPGSVLIDLIDSTTSLAYQDTGLVSRKDYLYVVQGKNASLTPTTSDFSFAVVLRPHPKVRLDSVVALSATQVKAWFSEPVVDRPEDLGHFVLDGAVAAAAMVGGGEPQDWMILHFPEEMTVGTHLLIVDSLWLDAYLGTIDPVYSTFAFEWQPDTTGHVWLTQWSAANDKEALLHFNLEMDGSSMDVSNYALEPFGAVTDISFEDVAHKTVRVRLGEPVLGALGYPVSIIVTNVRAVDGSRILEGEGNVATFSSHQDDLSDAYVYPNPVRPNQLFQGVRFANLTREATISIYTAAGRFVNTLTETDGDGGVDWNLRDSGGNLIPPGIYLFKVEAEGVEEFLGKFSLLEY